MAKISILMKQRRKQIGMSAETVAERTGLSAATIYRYESGDINNLGLDKVELIAKALNCSPVYLMGWEDEPKTAPPAEVVAVPTADNRYKEITDTLDTLNEAGIYEVEKHAKYIASQDEYKKPSESEVLRRKEEA